MTNAICMVGRPKAPYVSQGLSDYARRLKAWGGCELIAVKGFRAAKTTPVSEVMAKEGQGLLARLEGRDVVWALDREGRAWPSEEWAQELGRVRDQGARRLVLVIGGALGLSPEVLRRSDARVSLGPATLAHELAALVTIEQLYRAYTILAGMPYHRA